MSEWACVRINQYVNLHMSRNELIAVPTLTHPTDLAVAQSEPRLIWSTDNCSLNDSGPSRNLGKGLVRC
jgi:hypothetical protein